MLTPCIYCVYTVHMRDIQFRGKRVDNGEWAYGVPVTYRGGMFIADPKLFGDPGKWRVEAHEVDPETVGQYTGDTDENGTRIYDGDSLINATLNEGNPDRIPRVAKWSLCGWSAPFIRNHWAGRRSVVPLNVISDQHIVCGNIHDNLELREEAI